jgi:hypothetical protein
MRTARLPFTTLAIALSTSPDRRRVREPGGKPGSLTCDGAVAAGFEPAEGCPSRAFEARSFGHSDTPPQARLPQGPWQDRAT